MPAPESEGCQLGLVWGLGQGHFLSVLSGHSKSGEQPPAASQSRVHLGRQAALSAGGLARALLRFREPFSPLRHRGAQLPVSEDLEAIRAVLVGSETLGFEPWLATAWLCELKSDT